jgi:hypothetical protein
MKSLILLALLASDCMAQVPDAPKPQLDRTDWAILTADAGSRTLDVYSTRWMLAHGDREVMLPAFIAHHTPVMAAYSAGAVAIDYLGARLLTRHRHPKLAKVALLADFAQDAPWAIHNLYLPTAPKSSTRRRRQ